MRLRNVYGAARLATGFLLAVSGYEASADAGLNAPVEAHSKHISLAVIDADLRTVLHDVGRAAGLVFLISDAVKGRISADMHEQSPQNMLHSLLRAHGLGLEALQGGHWIAPLDELTRRARQDRAWQIARESRDSVRTLLLPLQHADAAELAILLTAGSQQDGERLLGPRGRVQTDKRTNTLLLTDSDARIEQLLIWLKSLDRPSRQVIVEARIAAITRTGAKSFGMRWRRLQQRSGLTVPLHVLGKDISTLSYGLLGIDGKSLDIELSAMEADGQGEVIATPSVMMAEQQKARISSGQQIPYQETTHSGATTTRFIRAELSLEVTPRITSAGLVELDVELSHDSPGTVQASGAVAIDTNRLKTHVSLADGQTLVLGGIYRSQTSENSSRVPTLGKLPYVGFLFRRDIEREDKQELLIFLTPRVVALSETNEMMSGHPSWFDPRRDTPQKSSWPTPK